MRTASPGHTFRLLVAVALVSVVIIEGDAFGQAPSSPSELDALERQLEDDLTSLATADCTIACKALESMIRSAARICELDPGPRCERAKGKVADATRRVRDACPNCAAAGEGEPETISKGAPSPKEAELQGDDASAPGSAPPAADKGGGCASCTVGGRGGDERVIAWLVSALLLGGLRRGRRRGAEG